MGSLDLWSCQCVDCRCKKIFFFLLPNKRVSWICGSSGWSVQALLDGCKPLPVGQRKRFAHFCHLAPISSLKEMIVHISFPWSESHGCYGREERSELSWSQSPGWDEASACSRLMLSAPSLVGSYIIHCVICARPSLLNMGENCHLAENHSGKREAIPTSAVLQVELWKDQSCCSLVKNREEAAVGYENPWWKGLGEATTDFLCSAGVARHVLKNRTMHK